jgi:hypothetical protein
MAEKHLLLTGDTRRFGNRVVVDGVEVDVSAPVIEVESEEMAAEIAHQIALGHAEHGHPDDVDIVDGKPVQRKFKYDDSHHRKHGRRAGKKG